MEYYFTDLYTRIHYTPLSTSMQKIEKKEKESSWLPSFIKRSRRSEPNISHSRKHSAVPMQLAAASAPEPEGVNEPSKGMLERRLSRPLTKLFTVGEYNHIDEPRVDEQTNCLRWVVVANCISAGV